MRIDKMTTLLQQALGEAQSLALAADHPYIEPAHLIKALLDQPDGPRSLLQRSGVNLAGLEASVETALGRIAAVQGAKVAALTPSSYGLEIPAAAGIERREYRRTQVLVTFAAVD